MFIIVPNKKQVTIYLHKIKRKERKFSNDVNFNCGYGDWKFSSSCLRSNHLSLHTFGFHLWKYWYYLYLAIVSQSAFTIILYCVSCTQYSASFILETKKWKRSWKKRIFVSLILYSLGILHTSCCPTTLRCFRHKPEILGGVQGMRRVSLHESVTFLISFHRPRGHTTSEDWRLTSWHLKHSLTINIQ